MFKKIDENKPINITLKDQNNIEIFSAEAATFEDASNIVNDWIKERPTISPWIKTFQNKGDTIVYNLQNIDVIFSNVNIEFTNIKEKNYNITSWGIPLPWWITTMTRKDAHMELLHKYLSNQISLSDFLKEADGKSFISEETVIDFITTGLEKAIRTYNYTHTDYISYGVVYNGIYLQYNITYYNRKKLDDASTQTVRFTSKIRFKIQVPKEELIKDNVKYYYVGEDRDGIKYYLREVPELTDISDNEFAKKYHEELKTNTLESLDQIYSLDPRAKELTWKELTWKGHYFRINRNISYNSPLTDDEYGRLSELLNNYAVIYDTIIITSRGAISKTFTSDYMKNKMITNTLSIMVRKMNREIHKIFEK